MKKILLVLLLGCSISVLAQAETQPFYFSDNLRKAISNCTPYTEEVYKKNPNMARLADQFFLIIKGKRKNECEVGLKIVFDEDLFQEYVCSLPRKGQSQLLEAMNDKSAQVETRTFEGGGSATDSRFNLAITEIIMKFCKLPE